MAIEIRAPDTARDDVVPRGGVEGDEGGARLGHAGTGTAAPGVQARWVSPLGASASCRRSAIEVNAESSGTVASRARIGFRSTYAIAVSTAASSSRAWLLSHLSQNRPVTLLDAGDTPYSAAAILQTFSERSMRPSEILRSRRSAVLAIASNLGATNVRVFGSVLHDADSQKSDVDLLVDVPRGTTLLDMVRLQRALEAELGVPVDVLTDLDLPPSVRGRVLQEARSL